VSDDVKQQPICSKCGVRYTLMHFCRHTRSVPAPRLVGIELNPGPPKRGKQGIKKRSRPNKPKKTGNTRRAQTVRRVRRGRGGGPIAQNDTSTILQHAAPQLSDILEKDEYVADLLGSGGTGALNITSYAFNPGQATLFPLGSAEAAKWTNYKCVSAEPYLLHEVSEFATDGSTGKVILAMDYNAANNIATTKQQLEDMHSASCMPCQDIGLKLIPRLLNRADPKYIRVGVQPAGTDIRLYDGGILYVAAIGQAGTTKVSELRIRYKFQLELPTLLNPGGGGGTIQNTQAAWFQSTAAETGAATTVDYPVLFATATVNGLSAVNTAGSFVLPAGIYSVDVDLQAVFTGNATVFFFELDKNGTDQLRADPAAVFSSGTQSQVNLHQSAVVTSNGTDAFVVVANSTYSTGAVSYTGSIRFVAV
jgi:hypothetical protein